MLFLACWFQFQFQFVQLPIVCVLSWLLNWHTSQVMFDDKSCISVNVLTSMPIHRMDRDMALIFAIEGKWKKYGKWKEQKRKIYQKLRKIQITITSSSTALML